MLLFLFSVVVLELGMVVRLAAVVGLSWLALVLVVVVVVMGVLVGGGCLWLLLGVGDLGWSEQVLLEVVLGCAVGVGGVCCCCWSGVRTGLGFVLLLVWVGWTGVLMLV